jgi:hypothetical protein
MPLASVTIDGKDTVSCAHDWTTLLMSLSTGIISGCKVDNGWTVGRGTTEMLRVSTPIDTGTLAVGMLAVVGKSETCDVAVTIAEPIPKNEVILLKIGINGLEGPVEEGWLPVVVSGPTTDDTTVGTDSIEDADAWLVPADKEETTLCNLD